MAGIVGLRGLEGFGDDAPPAIPLPPPPPRPPLTLAGTAMLIGSVALVGYVFWATLKGPTRKSAFVRNGKRFYRKKRR